MVVARAVISCGPGTILFAYACWNLGKDLASRKWPTVEGEVQSARHGRSYRGIVHLQLAYEYSVHGQRYVASRYSFGWTAGLAGGAKVHAFVANHPRGSKLKVHYNPRNPAQALIAPGLSLANLIGFATGIVFLLLGVLALGGMIGAEVYSTWDV